VCNKSKKKIKLKIKKNYERRKKNEKIPKVNLILSHVNHTFLISDLGIGPHAFRHTHCILGKSIFLNVKKGPIQISISFKLLPGFFDLACKPG
jgi:hypothetical protein